MPAIATLRRTYKKYPNYHVLNFLHTYLTTPECKFKFTVIPPCPIFVSYSFHYYKQGKKITSQDHKIKI